MSLAERKQICLLNPHCLEDKGVQPSTCGTFYLNVYFKHKYQHLKNLKACDIEDADEGRPLALGPVQSFVDAVDKPTKQAFICCLG